MASKRYKEQICDALETPLETPWSKTLGNLVGGFLAIAIGTMAIDIAADSLKKVGLLDSIPTQSPQSLSQEPGISVSNDEKGFLLN